MGRNCLRPLRWKNKSSLFSRRCQTMSQSPGKAAPPVGRLDTWSILSGLWGLGEAWPSPYAPNRVAGCSQHALMAAEIFQNPMMPSKADHFSPLLLKGPTEPQPLLLLTRCFLYTLCITSWAVWGHSHKGWPWCIGGNGPLSGTFMCVQCCAVQDIGKYMWMIVTTFLLGLFSTSYNILLKDRLQ